MLLGARVLMAPKGTRAHRRTGCAYAIAMLLVNGSALGIYRLFGGFGPFHVAAFISLLTLIAGLRPMLRRPRKEGWLLAHMNYMYWSVVGLYAAFASELMVRSPLRGGFTVLVAGGTVLTMVLAGLFQKRLMARWQPGSTRS
jgi:uncharacterized membrane protein